MRFTFLLLLFLTTILWLFSDWLLNGHLLSFFNFTKMIYFHDIFNFLRIIETLILLYTLNQFFKWRILMILSKLCKKITKFLINKKSLSISLCFIKSIKYLENRLIFRILVHWIWIKIIMRLTNSTKNSWQSINALFYN